jgi:hypothetical protein
MKVQISKAYKGTKHVGWKKTIGRRSWFLGYGTSPADEAKAVSLATALEAMWQLIKLGGGSELTQTDFDDARDLVEGRPRWSSAQSPDDLLPRVEAPAVRHALALPRQHRSALAVADPSAALPPTQAIRVEARPVSADGAPRRWLYASMEAVVAHVRLTLKPDGSNDEHVYNTIDRMYRSRDAIADIPLDQLRRKEIDEWLLAIRSMRSKLTSKPLAATTIRNVVAGARNVLTKAAEWEWWVPPPLWEHAFKPFTIKKLQTVKERKQRKKRAPSHTVAEKRVLWHLALPFGKAMMGLADWAGHTPKEISTLTFDEIIDVGGEMYIDRDRNKTGVPGRWWIPPEVATVVRKVIAKTSRDAATNPDGLAFLTPKHLPLVHRAKAGSRSRSDYVGNTMWRTLLRAASHYDVHWIAFKFMRKGTAQLIRDHAGKEVSRTCLAQADKDIQDEHYTRPSTDKVETVIRELYPPLRPMFAPIHAADWDALRTEIRKENGLPDEPA